MKQNSKQYEELISLVEFPEIPQEKAKARTCWILMNILRFLILSGLVLIFFIQFQFDNKLPLVIAILLLLVIFIYARFLFNRTIFSILNKDCDPIRFLAYYGTLLSYYNNNMKKEGTWELVFYNIAMGFYYADRMEEAETVLGLLKKYCPSSAGCFYNEIIEAYLASVKGDMQEARDHYLQAGQIGKYLRPTIMPKCFYERLSFYPEWIQMYQDGLYKELYNSVENTSVWDYVLISKVMQNYYLYRIAMLLGDKEQADAHKNFVLENGGRLWYRTELMEKGMNDLHAIPNK